MPGNDIVIAYAFLDTLAFNCHSVANTLAGSAKAMNLAFPNNEEVTKAYDDFLGKWDQHRSKLENGVRGSGDAIQTVSQSFSEVEDKLIAALNGDGES